AAAERHEVGTPTGRQRKLADAAEAEREQQPRAAAGNRARRLRLPAVLRDLDRPERGHAHPAALLSCPARSGNARARSAALACTSPRSVISPLTSRAGVTSNP